MSAPPPASRLLGVFGWAGALFLCAAFFVLPFLPAARRSGANFALEVRMASSAGGRVQVYYDPGGGFSEDRSSLLPLRGGAEERTCRLNLPPGKYRALRFDPIDREAIVRFEAARIVDDRGRTLRRFSPGDFLPLNQIQSVEIRNGITTAVVTPGGNDPQFLLRLSPPLSLTIGAAAIFRQWAPRTAGLFAIFLVLAGLFRVTGFTVDPARIHAWGTRRPRAAVGLIALLGVALNTYPVLFLGKSYASPNFGTSLLYDGFPTLPGYSDSEVVGASGSDLGALLWQAVPYGAIQHRSILRDHALPLWNRYDSGGTPLLAQGQSMFGDPLHWLVILADSASWAWDAKFVLAKLLLAVALGLIVLDLAGHAPSACLVAFAAPFCGFFLYRVNHPAFFSFCYAPWTLLCWLRIARTESKRAFAGWCAGLVLSGVALLCSGTVKEAYILFLLMTLAGAAVLAATPSPRRWIKFGWLLWIGILFAGLTAPAWYGFLETLRQAYTSYGTAAANQIEPNLLLGVFDEVFYRPIAGGAVSEPSANFLILGGLLYFITTLRERLADRAVMAVAAVSLIPLGFAFGFVPASWIVRIPFIGHVVHVDSTFSCGLILLWSALAGVGLAAAARRLGTPRGRRDLVLSGLLLAALIALYLARGPIPFPSFVWGDLLLLTAALAAFGILSRFSLKRGRLAPAAGLGGILCLWILLWRFGLQPPAAGFEPYIVRPPVRVNFQARSPTIDRVAPSLRADPSRVVGLESTLSPGWTAMYGIEGITGPDALINPYYRELTGLGPIERVYDWRLTLDRDRVAAARPFLDFLNVRYYVGPEKDRTILEKSLRLDQAADLDLFESPTAWPRAFFTDRIAVYDRSEGLIGRILQGDGRPFAAVQGSDAAAMARLGAMSHDLDGREVAPASGYELKENRTSFSIRSDRAGVAVLSEAYWPGYPHARLDGRPVAVVRINHCFEGIPVPTPGNHRIEVSYRPRHFTALAALAWGAAAVLLATLLVLTTSPPWPRRSS